MFNTVGIVSVFFFVSISVEVFARVTVDDFYTAPSPLDIITFTSSGAEFSTDSLTLPTSVNNIINATVPLTTAQIAKGAVRFQSGYVQINGLRSNVSNGMATLVLHNNAILINRVHQDIQVVHPYAPRPTFLLMATTSAATATTGRATNLQITIASNGQYTYLIILIASIEPDAVTRGDEANIIIGDNVTPLPYSSNIANAPAMTNSGLPGRYIIDLNDVPVPRSLVCNIKMLQMMCEAIQLHGGTPPSSVCGTI